MRIGRYLNIILGLIVSVGPWLTANASTGHAITCTAAGLAVIANAMPRGPKKETYGAWDQYVR